MDKLAAWKTLTGVQNYLTNSGGGSTSEARSAARRCELAIVGQFIPALRLLIGGSHEANFGHSDTRSVHHLAIVLRIQAVVSFSPSSRLTLGDQFSSLAANALSTTLTGTS